MITPRNPAQSLLYARSLLSEARARFRVCSWSLANAMDVHLAELRLADAVDAYCDHVRDELTHHDSLPETITERPDHAL